MSTAARPEGADPAFGRADGEPTEILLDLTEERPLVGRVRREVLGIGAAWRQPTVRRGLLGMVLVSYGSLTPAFLPAKDANPFQNVPGISWMQGAPGMWVGTAIMMAGVLLLIDAWLRMRPGPGRPVPLRETLWLWSAPILLAPPLFSHDAFSYAAQGWLTDRGLNPYIFGPSVGAEIFRDKVDPMWLDTPAPYGPLALQIQRLIVHLCGDHAYTAAVLMRLPAFAGVLLLAVFLPRLARALGYDGPRTTWLAVLNPLVVMHLVGGSHNDSLMLGFMVLGIYLAARHHPWLGAVAVGAAGTIKLPAIAAVVALAALAARTPRRTQDPGDDDPPGDPSSDPPGDQGSGVPTLLACVRWLVPIGVVTVLAFVAISYATGLGFGWISALAVPASLRSILSPAALLGMLVEWVSMRLSLPFADSAFKAVTTLTQVVGLAWCAWYAAKHGPRAPLRTLGRVILVIVFTGPTVLPWYVLWGGLLYAMTVLRRREEFVVVWATAALALYSAVDASFRNGALAMGATAAIAIAWLATGHSRTLDRSADVEAAEVKKAARV